MFWVAAPSFTFPAPVLWLCCPVFSAETTVCSLPRIQFLPRFCRCWFCSIEFAAELGLSGPHCPGIFLENSAASASRPHFLSVHGLEDVTTKCFCQFSDDLLQPENLTEFGITCCRYVLSAAPGCSFLIPDCSPNFLKISPVQQHLPTRQIIIFAACFTL